ncbi:MAG: hypothetical protein JWO05_1787 [Gemmatimonadetes bacterium]|nr:hypothetical protein [Gemmatimonadota bacterium]
MWSDALLHAERLHLLRLTVWGVACVVVGTSLFAMLAVRRLHSPLLRHFAMQSAAWGAIDLAIATWSRSQLQLRDLASATQLDRLLWLNAGLDVGYVIAGVTLACTGWILGKRLGAVGAGLGVTVQGVALLVLDARFMTQVVR